MSARIALPAIGVQVPSILNNSYLAVLVSLSLEFPEEEMHRWEQVTVICRSTYNKLIHSERIFYYLGNVFTTQVSHDYTSSTLFGKDLP